MALGFPTSCSSSSSIKMFPFFFLHIVISFTTISHLHSFIQRSTNFSTFLHPFSLSMMTERWFAFVTPLADITARLLTITLKISILPCLCKFSDAFDDSRLVNKLSKFDDIRSSPKLVSIQHTASGNSKLNIRNIDSTWRLGFGCVFG